MRWLISSIHYWPEPIGIGKVTGEMVQWLCERGHDVEVIAAVPFYPGWQIADGYSVRPRREVHGRAVVHRVPLWVPASPSGAKRIAHLSSFAAAAAIVAPERRPDIVFTVQPTFFTAARGLGMARRARAVSWHHIQDFELDAALDLGLLSIGPLQRLLRATERRVLDGYDHVSAISQAMLDRVRTRLRDPSRAHLFPNWVDTNRVCCLQHVSPYRARLGIAPDTVVVMYSGNFGRKQGLEVLVDAAGRCQSMDIRFVLAGDGGERRALEASAKGLTNITWLPLQAEEDFNDFMGLADIHVLPQRADAADLVMPSKLNTMLASGRPVIATARTGTQLERVVRPLGRVVDPGSSEALAAAILDLASNAPERRVLGAAARTYAEQALSRDSVLGAFEALAIDAVERKAALGG